MAKNQETVDAFNGAQFTWTHISKKSETKRIVYQGQNTAIQEEGKCFHLTFHKKHKETVFDLYFPFILSESERIREEKKTLKIHTLNSDEMRRYSRGDHAWNSVSLDLPSTFETLAMDGDLKREIIEDLETFVNRRDFYRRVGKAWKRGYLSYGPPGTGKSSLIATMANYLKIDIYDLELTYIHANSELRRLLIRTTNSSIIVVEDIDCSLNLDDNRKEEAHVKKSLKSSQVNKGGSRNFSRTFKTLAFNYLGMTDHPVFLEVESFLEKAMVTPAEVAEQLIKEVDPEAALRGLIEFLGEKKREREEMETRKLKEEQERERIQTQKPLEQTVVVD
ncbi:hypothetical protein LguiB_022273 [Lonicera macranthoides]